MTITKVTERVSVYYSGQVSILKYLLNQSCGPVEVVDEKKLKIFKTINVNIDNKIITLEVKYFVNGFASEILFFL